MLILLICYFIYLSIIELLNEYLMSIPTFTSYVITYIFLLRIFKYVFRYFKYIAVYGIYVPFYSGFRSQVKVIARLYYANNLQLSHSFFVGTN